MTANEFRKALDAAKKRLEGVTDLAVWDRELDELERMAPPVPEASAIESLCCSGICSKPVLKRELGL